jgi:sulfoxide reductase heme-binding subunit YedZ
MPLRLKVLHEALSLSGLVAIAAHGALLLGDSFLHPTLAQVAIPFLLPVHRLWTGIGVVAGWLAALIVLSFYVRGLIGVTAWRKLHRLTYAVYLMGIAHTLGAGSDARSLWLLAILAVTAIPVVALSAITRPWAERSPRSARLGANYR